MNSPKLATLLFAILFTSATNAFEDKPLRIATFEADVTCPPGTPLCDGLVQPAKRIDDRLSARGIVLIGAEKPIVLCAVDWVGIGNSGHDAFREALAKAAGTTKDRVCVHCLHPHDAPGCDFAADALLVPSGLGGKLFDPTFARKAIERTAEVVNESMKSPRTVTHFGTGKAKVVEVASNRRVMGADGKVKFVRTSATKDPKVRAEPEGLVDPYIQTLAFFDGKAPIAVLTYYATHPQSHYGKGGVSCDFPGIARGLRDRAVPGAMHVHFNGAGGNVTAGKYNDGTPANRMILAERLAQGMKQSFDSISTHPITARDLSWRRTRVVLPPAKHCNVKEQSAKLADSQLPELDRLRAARNLAWAKRCEAGESIDVQCLGIGDVRVLHLPGELFVEYQLAAQKMRPQSAVMTAAYGDYGMGYIGTAAAYTQGGYETGPVSRVAPEVEDVLMSAIRDLLN